MGPQPANHIIPFGARHRIVSHSVSRIVGIMISGFVAVLLASAGQRSTMKTGWFIIYLVGAHRASDSNNYDIMRIAMAYICLDRNDEVPRPPACQLQLK